MKRERGKAERTGEIRPCRLSGKLFPPPDINKPPGPKQLQTHLNTHMTRAMELRPN